MGKRKNRRKEETAKSQSNPRAPGNRLSWLTSHLQQGVVIAIAVVLVVALVAIKSLITERPDQDIFGDQGPVSMQDRQPPQTLKVSRPPNRLPETKLGPAVTSDGIAIQQSYLTCPKGRIIVDHFPVDYAQFGGMVDARVGEFKEHYSVDGELWYQGSDKGYVLTTFNCFTFAIAPFIGLTPNDRLEAAITPGFGNPLEIAFDSFFVKVATFDLSSSFRSEQFDKDTSLRNGDVFCLVNKHYGEVRYVHAGRIKKIDGVNRLISKFGRMGPILLTDWRYVFRHYKGNEIRVFRFDPFTRRGSLP